MTSRPYVFAWTSYAVSEKPCTPQKASCSPTNRAVPPEMGTGRSERLGRRQDGFDHLARQAARLRVT
jgi:hypothetical protein